MKIAVGMRKAEQIYDAEYLRFLRQIGVTHVLGFMPDTDVLPSAKDGCWSEEDLKAMVKHYNENGLVCEAVENFLPRHWYKILMDLPGKEQQLEAVKRTIANQGKAKIPIMGYNFSAGGVIGRHVRRSGAATRFPLATTPSITPSTTRQSRALWRGGRSSTRRRGASIRRLGARKCARGCTGFWSVFCRVCADANVRLAAHPEDPPVPELRGAGRVLISPQDYDEMFTAFPTPYCCVEFCQGTFTEMGVDVYETIEHFASQGRIAYVHLRNVRGTVPSYDETLIDDGDVNMAQALLAYQKGGYEGTFIPDHYPELASAQGSHATVAYSIGYIRGLMKALDIPIWGE